MQGNIKLLDCTLRDGGQGLEDLNKNGIKTEIFTLEDREHIVGDLVDSQIDIIELGCMAESVENKTGFAIYQNIEELSANIPRNKCMLDCILDQIQKWRKSQNILMNCAMV